MVQKVILQYYVLIILTRCGISIITATYVMFLLSKGLNLFEVNLVNVVFFTTLFICEVPTGAFADVFGRKASFVLSCFIFSMGMIFYSFSNTFWEFAFAEALSAVGATFATGAFSSWLVDTLKHHNYDQSTKAIFAKGAQLRHGVGIVAALVGAYLSDISMSLPWLVGGILFAVAGMTALIVMKEEYFVREKFSFLGGWIKLKDVAKTSVEYGVKNKNIRFIMLLVLGLNFATMAPNMQWQPYFKQWLPNQTTLGFLWSGMALAMMLGAWLAPKILKKVADERKALLYCHSVTALCIVGTVALGILPVAVLIFFMHEVARGAFEPIKETYLHDNIPSSARATIVSFESIAHHAGGAIGLVASGALALYGSITLAWIVSGAVLLTVTFSLRK
ncbi:MAG: MFS transporter [Candidatus Pacebacteria bacterium]|nr:MFS transporter [Candidatus Paceibacterota bacterium]